jgi:hypothetical protein
MSKCNDNYVDMSATNGTHEELPGFDGITWRLPCRVATMARGLRLAAVGVAVTAAGGSMAALAAGPSVLDGPQFNQNPMDVRHRPRPEYDPMGVPVGSFLLFPSLDIGEAFNSNIYATETNETSDFITTYAPSLTLVSDWNNHAVALSAHANGGVYAENSDENFFDYGFSAGGRLDVRRSTSVSAATSWDHRHEDRGSPEDVNGDEPSEYDEFAIGIGGATSPGRLSLGVDGNYTHLDFQNVQDNTGTTINNDDRNQSIWEGIVRAGYAFKSDYEVFVQGTYTDIVYDETFDDNGLNRDNNGWRADLGLAFDITDTLAGDVYGGYLQRYYDDPAFTDTGSFDLGADLFWSITPLTTAHALVFRNFVETTQAGASSILETTGRIEIDHELMRNVIIGGHAALSNFQYEGISRDDDVWRFGADGRYLINRNFYVGGGADYITRDSNAPTESYDQFNVGVFVGAQM